jgi:hypothetical protein
MGKLRSIIKGWRNSFRKLPPNISQFYKDRLSVCKQCDWLKAGICTACGCVVSKKTKSLQEMCPENFWSPSIYEENDVMFVIKAEIPQWLLDIFHTHYPQFLPNDRIILDAWIQFLETYEAEVESA